MQQAPYYPPNTPLGELVTLVAATADVNSNTMVNGFFRGLTVYVNITALTGTSPTVTVTIEAYDSVSQGYVTLLESAALAATGLTMLQIYPGIASLANESANAVLPNEWRIAVALGGTTPAVTGSISANYQN